MTPSDLGWADFPLIFVASVFGLCAMILVLDILCEEIPKAWRRFVPMRPPKDYPVSWRRMRG